MADKGKMREQDSIPTSKVQRAAKFIKTGAKVGGNYVKHYSKKLFDPNVSRDELDADNAEDIYNSLSELKGSALKVAQMLSMDKNVLPTAYQEKFTMAQYSAPPLSFPLVVKTFQKYFGKSPSEIFDTFTTKAVNAASIGQVHMATLDGKKLAVKIQYPGVADSVSADLKMVKPMATRLFKMNLKDLDRFMGEVESKLLEETDYDLELKRSVEISQACKHIPHLEFPGYYPEYSSERIIVMDWVEGMHLREYLKTNPSQEERNKIGQAMWDFYDFQVHGTKQVHADPHPGNFIITNNGNLGIIDFGCVKVIPEDFYTDYFKLLEKDVLHDQAGLDDTLYKLEMISTDDTPREKALFKSVYLEMIDLLGKPFHTDTFDFGNDTYFQQIYEVGERVSHMKEFRNSRTARGSHHALYINRTYFGLYNILNELKATVMTSKSKMLV